VFSRARRATDAIGMTTLTPAPSIRPLVRTRPAVDIAKMLHPVSPYVGFDASQWKFDPQGWNGNAPLFTQLVAEVRPAITIEVGSWKGQSAIHLASRMAQQRSDAQLVCVDTWLGSFDWWLNPSAPPLTDLALKNGYPTLYWQFLANIVHAGLQDFVVPFPATSTIAARLMIARNVRADLVYIDASHEENDVYMDIAYWWHVLRAGGMMFGDDYRSDFYPGVVRAVTAFASEQGLQHEVVDNQFWVLRKPAP